MKVRQRITDNLTVEVEQCRGGSTLVWLHNSDNTPAVLVAGAMTEKDAVREAINWLRLTADALGRWPAPEEPFEP